MRAVVGWMVFFLVLIGGFVWQQWPDDNLHITTCDVGQGDAILVTHGFTQVLIDGGPNNKVQTCLEHQLPFWDRQIELVILTHPQLDHYGGLAQVMRRYSVSQFVANGVGSEAKRFAELVETVAVRQVPVHVPALGDELVAGSLHFQVLWPKAPVGGEADWVATGKCLNSHQDEKECGGNKMLTNYPRDANEIAVTLHLQYGEVGALFTGDIGTREELALNTLGVIPEAEILKVAHHGSKNSSSLEFLRVLKPRLALISVGKDNSYGHPTMDTLMHLDQVGAEIWRTDEKGEVELLSDGQKIWIEK